MFILLIILFCLAKTFIGDIIAGKIDSIEWKILVLSVFISSVICFINVILNQNYLFVSYEYLQLFVSYEYLQLFFVMTIIQLISELGDNYLEHYVFFRHRYSFEIMTIIALYMFNLNELAKLIIYCDLIMCFCYRLSNFLIILQNIQKT
jgi:hypothetical protein